MRYILLKLIAAYQLIISPCLPGTCRFLPSCSEYARQAVIRHGPARGAVLAFFRIIRCHPLCAPGHDPVPDRFSLAGLRGQGAEHDHKDQFSSSSLPASGRPGRSFAPGQSPSSFRR
ncbi:MAG: membrane protein insertion efficiency factor YidD [Desulfonatronovibrionaceae bacterium]